MGDSAGGNIVLEVAQTLRDRGLAQPRQLILISPVLDISKSNPSIPAVARYDRVLSLAGSSAGQHLYAGGLDSKDPLVSPLYADLTGLAPMVLFSGTHDIHNPDARDFAGRAREAGVSMDYREIPGGLHSYALMPTAEGKTARILINALVGG